MPADRQFCSECGTSNESDAVFCESCGHRLDDSPAPAEHVAEAAPPPKASRRISPKAVALLLLLVVGVAGATVLRAPIASFLGSSKEAPTTPADSVELVPVAGDPQLNDNPTGDEPPSFVLTDPSGTQTVVQTQRPRTPNAPPLGSRTQSVRPSTVPEPEVRRSNPIPGTPTPFPEGFTPPATLGAPAEPPVVRTDAPASPPARAAGRIPAGSVLSLRSAAQVCTDKTREGARFKAVVQQEVEGSNGATIPSGSVVTFVVDRLKRPAAPNEKLEFSIAAESIELNGARVPVTATVDAVAIKQKGRSLLGALAGAAAVAAATRAAGGDTKQTVAGGVAGGAAGAVVGSQLKTGEGCIEKNSAIRITLGADITPGTM